MQPWSRTAVPAQDDASSTVDGFAFVLEQKAADKEAEPPVPLTRRETPKTVRLTGQVQPESWCRLGTQVLPRLGKGTDVRIGIDISVTVEAGSAVDLKAELRQALHGLGLAKSISVEA